MLPRCARSRSVCLLGSVLALATLHCNGDVDDVPDEHAPAPPPPTAALAAPPSTAPGDPEPAAPEFGEGSRRGAMAMGAAERPLLAPNPGPKGLYLGKQSSITVDVTPKKTPVPWGAATAIDPNYGGILYAGTPLATKDPRPPLEGGKQPLRLWIAKPNNDVAKRPAILWFHGGGFAMGLDAMYGLANTDGREYAQRGYVSVAVEYRMDTTMILDEGPLRPLPLCQWVQQKQNPGNALWEARKAKCESNIIAAQRDALASIRWLRKNAAEYGVDPTRIAVGGFSAGAIIASNTAYQSDDIGDELYFQGDRLLPAASRPGAVFGASGCTYAFDDPVPPTIGPGDAPASFIHAELDAAVPYACAEATFATARSKGLVAELTSYCGVGGHGSDLYDAKKAATDTQWTTFLARELGIYSGMRPPSSDPFCK